jgi:phosphatidylserine decarboxylase
MVSRLHGLYPGRMTTIEQTKATGRVPTPITSTQPGAGFGMRLELVWGRLRRAWLRRIRPGHVRSMLARRQGQCDQCPHDVIDPRDLKYFRNVCGYWFRDEDDPFRWRGRLGLARDGLAELLLFTGAFILLTVPLVLLALWVHVLFWLPAAITAGLALFIVSFFRDPERAIPSDPWAVLSPADGTITHVDEVAEEDFPGGRAFRVSIFLSVFNVHVNRVPRSGRVVGIRYFAGCFKDARTTTCGEVNEQLWLDIGEGPPGRLVRVKQIAGAVARRIVCRLRPGEVVSAGDRYGMIKFGSRTDVCLPVAVVEEVLVKVGDRVKGGATILARVKV